MKKKETKQTPAVTNDELAGLVKELIQEIKQLRQKIEATPDFWRQGEY